MHEEPKEETWGCSVNKTRMSLFNQRETIPENVTKIFDEVIEKVKSKEMEIEEAKVYLGEFGESVEKVLMYRTLILMENSEK